MNISRFKSIIQVVLFLCLVLGLSSCDYYDSQNDPAAYLVVDSVSFRSTQGITFNDQKIGHINVYINGQFQGGYLLPARIPITQLGKRSVSILAGIYADGIFDARVEYPYFTQFKDTILFQEGQSVRVVPKFSYVPSIVNPCKVQENFEGESQRPVLDSLNTTYPIVKIPHGVSGFPYCSAYYGEIRARQGDTALLQVASLGYFQEKLIASPVYLEFEYKSNIPLVVGLLAYDTPNNVNQYQSVYDLYLRPKTTWTKVYCDLTQEVQAFGTDSDKKYYKIFFRGVTDGTSSQYFNLDNVRYVSRQQ